MKILIQRQITYYSKRQYGLVQAARQWCRKFISNFVENYKKSQADACVLIRENEHRVIIPCIYVNDDFMVGDHTANKNMAW